MKRLISITLSILLAVLVGGQIGQIYAQTSGELIYLSDTGSNEGKTTLYKVYLNTVSGRAELTPLPDVGYGPGAIPFDSVVAFACTPDGKKLYCVESQLGSSYYHHLGLFDLTSSSFEILGPIQGMGFRTQQAAFSVDGTLYIGNQQQDELWIVGIDPNSPTYLQASEVGSIQDGDTLGVPDVNGADIVFDAHGDLYLWVNKPGLNAPGGLYLLTLPENPGSVWAVYLGFSMGGFTGLAIRANGYGDLVGSITTPSNSILVIDKENASIIASYPMYLDGLPYDYSYGDMSVSSLSLCTKTIGYWKNHSWNDTGITICNTLVLEEEGTEILRSARGNDYSMLFAQLIAAKLNTNNSTGIAQIEAAENYICSKWLTGWQRHVDDPIPKSEKKDVVALWRALDAFNNQFPCQ